MTDVTVRLDKDGSPDDAAGDADDAARDAPPPEETKPRTKAEKLEAKAARLRAAEARRAERAPAGRPVGWMVTSGVLAALLVAAVVVGFVYGISRRNAVEHNAALTAARTQAIDTAKSAAVAFGSYDYRHLDRDFQNVLSRLSPTFRTTYTPIAEKLRPTIEQAHGVATAEIQGIGVSSLSTTHAVVVVFLDQTVSSSQAKTKEINRNRALLTLDKQKDGRWLVSDLRLR